MHHVAADLVPAATIAATAAAATTAAAAAAAAAAAPASTTAVAASLSTAAVAAPASASAVAAPATATATAILTRFRLVYGQWPAIVLRFIQSGDRRLSLGVGGHLDEAKAFASASITIGDHLRRFRPCRTVQTIAPNPSW